MQQSPTTPDDLATRLADAEAAQEAERREATRHIRNVLAVMRSLASRTGEEVSSVEEYQTVLDGRITALGRIYALPPHQAVEGFDLWDLVADTLVRMGLGVGERVELHGDPVRLTLKAAGSIALLLHELALDLALRPPEPVRIEWSPAPDGLLIRWGQPRGADRRVPDWLERAIAYELRGTIAEEGARGLSVRLPRAAVTSSD